MPVPLFIGAPSIADVQAHLNTLVNAIGGVPLVTDAAPADLKAQLNKLIGYVNAQRGATVPLLVGPQSADDLKAALNNLVNIINANPAGPSYVGPLDIVADAVVAYGQRALSTAMLGQPLYTLRRSSDNAMQQFSSDAASGDAPADDIEEFIGAGSGFITAWHDQSGNGADAEQAVAGAQPQWGSATPPTLEFNGTSDWLVTADAVALPGVGTVFMVLRQNSGGKYLLFGGDQFVGPDFYLSANADPTSKLLMGGDSADFNSGTSIESNAALGSSLSIVDATIGAGTVSFAVNGAAIGNGNDTSYGGGAWSLAGVLAIGANDSAGPTDYIDADIFELIIYPEIIVAEQRAAVRQNMAAYYGITLA